MKRICFLLWMCWAVVRLPAQPAEYTNSIGMQFVLIKPGSMIVGRFRPAVSMNGFASAKDVPQLPDSVLTKAGKMAEEDAREGFRVTLDKPYYLGRFEVTQAQWRRVMSNNPAYFQKDKVADDADQHPVENISWEDAQAFIARLNELEKGKAVYRLPGEFEWEFAARAGAEDDIPWSRIGKMAVIATQSTHRVGSKEPNAWGLYDMLGNVWEWVADFYNEKLFADPVPPVQGTEHVLKGAPFYGDVKNATYMTHAGGPGSGYDTGFRVLMEVRP